jgi:SAM-dependent methyltransferase
MPTPKGALSVSRSDDLLRSTEAAWNLAAVKYRAEIEGDVEFLRAGGVSLSADEIRLLGDLANCRRAVHLQCSHGLDGLSLLNLGVHEIVGVDLSREMLAQAARKSELLSARARWIRAPVLELPGELDSSADLVYTGKGALPWVADLEQWARGVSRVLRPGGRLFLHEGHPLNWIWGTDASMHQLRTDGRSYFDRVPWANDNFPGRAAEQYAAAGEEAPKAWEYQWTIGAVVTALSAAGLRIERLEEHADHFWPQFLHIAARDLQRVPHGYSVLALRPTPAA